MCWPPQAPPKLPESRVVVDLSRAAGVRESVALNSLCGRTDFWQRWSEIFTPEPGQRRCVFTPWITFVAFLGQTKVLAYAKRTTVIVRNVQSRFNHVQVRYRDATIPNLAVTKIAVWNAGTQAIHDNDIASLDPLCIRTIKDVAILDCQIISSNCNANNFCLKGSETVTISFELMRKKEGAVIQILHTGSKGSDVQFEGSLKDAPRLKRYQGGPFPSGFPVTVKGMGQRKMKIGIFITAVIMAAALYFEAGALYVRPTSHHWIK